MNQPIENSTPPNPLVIGHLFSEAWSDVPGFKRIFWGGLGLVLAVGIVLVGLSLPFYYLVQWTGMPHLGHFILALVIQLFFIPVNVGLGMLSVRRVAQAPVKSVMVFNYYRWSFIFRFFIASFLFYCLNTIVGLIPMTLLWIVAIVVMLWVNLVWYLTLILIAEKQMRIGTAMGWAFRAGFRQFFKMLGIAILSLVLALLGLITLGIGYIWILPFINNIYAVLYRQLFGIGKLA